jgi:hypothetical protein
MTAVTLRLYCQGIGDCNLIEIPRSGKPPFRILIDCGMHSSTPNGTDKLRSVVTDLAARCTAPGAAKPRLDVIVGTHEHWDHLSGFSTAADLFKTFDVGEVWLAWTENPDDPQARTLDKYKGFAPLLDEATAKLAAVAPGTPLAEGMAALAGFRRAAPDPALLGAKGDTIREARDALTGLVAKDRIRYLKPGTALLDGDGAAPMELGVSAYVMGPPTDPSLIKKLEIASQMYALDAAGDAAEPLERAFAVARGDAYLDDDPTAPFDATEGVPLDDLAAGTAAPALQHFFDSHYFKTLPEVLRPSKFETDSQDWRRIDGDWMGAAANLAMQLDSQTNNTSLVLAFELEPGGEVMLFAADAQIGNWISWPQVNFDHPDGRKLSGLDLINRTGFYKVGHHGSANATQSGSSDYPGGLEAMDAKALKAFIPTDESMAKAVKWGAIPAPKLLKRLVEMTGGAMGPAGVPTDAGRVIRADQVDAYVKSMGPKPDWLQELGPATPLLQRLYVQLEIGG